MTDLARLVVALEAQTEKYREGFDNAQKRLDKFANDQSSSLKGVEKRMSSFGSTIRNGLAAIGVGFSFKAIVDATSEAEHAQALLNNALETAGANVKLASVEFQNWASTLQRTTTFNDEAIMQVETLLLSFRGLSGDVVKQATASVLDLSARLGIDAAGAAKLLGRALVDPEKGMDRLARKGIIFSDAQKEQAKALIESGHAAEAQGLILAKLEERFGGAAVAARQTFGGALTGLKNSFDDLLEGKSGMNGATEAINNLTEVLNSPDVKRGFDNLLSGIFKVIEYAAKGAAALGDFVDGARTRLDSLLGYEPDLLPIDKAKGQLEEAKAILNAYREAVQIPFISENAIARQTEYVKQLEDILNKRIAISELSDVKVTAQRITPKGGKNDALDFTNRGTDDEDDGISDATMKARLKAAQEMGEGIYAVETLITDLQKQEKEKREALAIEEYEGRTALEETVKSIQQQDADERIELEQNVADIRFQVEQDLHDKMKKLEENRIMSATNLLGILFGKHKAVAAAIFLIQKRHAIAETVIDTKKAVMATYARLGYPFGIPAAIAVGALGAASIAEMIATNPGTAGIITGGGGNGFTPPGSKDNPVHTTEQDSKRRGVDENTATQIIFNGDVYGLDDFQEKVFQAMDTGINVRDRVPIRANSRQALELKG